MLRHSTKRGLITALVTNGSFDRDYARRLFPWLRWLVVSVDSHLPQTNEQIGRRSKGNDGIGQPARVERLAAWLHEWNRHRPHAEHVHLKLNIVVNAMNALEDPTEWISALRPQRIKLLQCTVIPGENDDAAPLAISTEVFEKYAARLQRLSALGITVVAEPSASLIDSYAMIDPLGRFRQSHGGRYTESQPIVAVGLDGSGKSTLTKELAARLGAVLVTNPPLSLRHERAAADQGSPSKRRDWYRMANATAMEEATDHVFRARSAVMDRSYASTFAYAAEEAGRVARAQDVPAQVSRPDVLVLLELREEVRAERLRGRGDTRTDEENRLNSDHAFRARVLDGYRALGAASIDAERSPETIITEILALLERA